MALFSLDLSLFVSIGYRCKEVVERKALNAHNNSEISLKCIISNDYNHVNLSDLLPVSQMPIQFHNLKGKKGLKPSPFYLLQLIIRSGNVRMLCREDISDNCQKRVKREKNDEKKNTRSRPESI